MLKFVQIVFTALFSLLILFLLTKMTGNKQVSQLTLFDYINGISIGSIAAEMATELENPLYPMTAMIVYASVAFLSSYICSKSPKVRRLIFGHTRVLYADGKLFRKELKRARIDLSEFLMQCRSAGYFDLRDIKTAVMEPSGTISFLPAAAARPATVSDLNLSVNPTAVPVNIVCDGMILEQNLFAIDRNKEWLFSEMKNSGFCDVKEIFLATAARGEACVFYPIQPDKQKNDLFF